MSGAQKDNKNTGEELLTEPTGEETVPKKAYSETKADMLKYKSEAKDLKAKLAQLEADQAAEQKQKLREEENWKALAAKFEKELEETKNKFVAKSKDFETYNKRAAVIQALGGLKKNSYSEFIDLSKVEVDEAGNITEESVQAEAERFRKEHPELLKANTGTSLPNQAAKPGQVGEKDISKMTKEERYAYIEELSKKM